MSTFNLLDAISVAKENERISSACYADAARKINNPMGKKLFEQLADFENFHYEQLTGLETSLKESGDYINYGGKEFPRPPKFELKAAQEPNTKSVLSIIRAAIDLEKQAEQAYADLTVQAMDPKGYEMISKLSEEEYKHRCLLQDAYWALNNLGTGKWTRP